ncbi:MAG: serine hydrolase [Clostridia bacterium]|nr:serine hydrolase [Clostridia bacterium]
MKPVRKLLCVLLSVLVLAASAFPSVHAACLLNRGTHKEHEYTISKKLQSELNKIYDRYDFSIAWGLYDISGKTLKEVASYHAGQKFQSNCTIKAMMLLYICKQMDAGKLSLDTKLKVNLSQLSYDDFGSGSGKYTVQYLLKRMIHISNNTSYEVLLRYVGRDKFNAFIKSLGSGTVVESYNYMGECTTKDRATEWFALYHYCHSGAKHASYAWDVLCKARSSPIRDGIGRPAAHKSGWYYSSGSSGTAGDCAVVQTENGGCYLMIIFTKNHASGRYSMDLIEELAATLDRVWDEYYLSIPRCRRKKAAF